jgi:hypothetical protein
MALVRKIKTAGIHRPIVEFHSMQKSFQMIFRRRWLKLVRDSRLRSILMRIIQLKIATSTREIEIVRKSSGLFQHLPVWYMIH